MIAPLACPAPWVTLRGRLLERAAALAEAGDTTGAAVLRTLVEAWWADQRVWDAGLSEALGAAHEINNALVGVSGNAQLVLMGLAGEKPAVRERLLVVLQEADRIQRATRGLQQVRQALGRGADREEAGHGADANAA